MVQATGDHVRAFDIVYADCMTVLATWFRKTIAQCDSWFAKS